MIKLTDFDTIGCVSEANCGFGLAFYFCSLKYLISQIKISFYGHKRATEKSVILLWPKKIEEKKERRNGMDPLIKIVIETVLGLIGTCTLLLGVVLIIVENFKKPKKNKMK